MSDRAFTIATSTNPRYPVTAVGVAAAGGGEPATAAKSSARPTYSTEAPT